MTELRIVSSPRVVIWTEERKETLVKLVVAAFGSWPTWAPSVMAPPGRSKELQQFLRVYSLSIGAEPNGAGCMLRKAIPRGGYKRKKQNIEMQVVAARCGFYA